MKVRQGTTDRSKYKLLALVLVLLVVVTLAACTWKEQLEQSDFEEEDNRTSTDAESPLSDPEVSIQQQVILDRDGIVITVQELVYRNSLGPKLILWVENNRDKAITVRTNDESINGVMMYSINSYTDVKPGQEGPDSIQFYTSILERAGIDIIKDIEFTIAIEDAATYKTLFSSDLITLTTTTDTDYVQSYNDSGTLLYDENGIKLVFQGKDEEVRSFVNFYIYIENFTDGHITIIGDDTSVNGITLNTFFISMITTGKRDFAEMNFLKKDLLDNGIENIEELAFSIRIYSDGSPHPIKSDLFVITF